MSQNSAKASLFFFMAVCKKPKLFALLVPRGTELFANFFLAQKFRKKNYTQKSEKTKVFIFGPRESELFGKMVPRGSELLALLDPP